MSGLRHARSAVYVPAGEPARIGRALASNADVIIIDIEDAVPSTAKAAARTMLAAHVQAASSDGPAPVVRINSLDDGGVDDLAALADAAPAAVLVPKCEAIRDVTDTCAAIEARLAAATAVWLMIETPAAVLDARDFAAVSNVGGLVLGYSDLAARMRVAFDPDGDTLSAAASSVLLAARAHDVVVLDGIDLTDDPAPSCQRAARRGFDGKTLLRLRDVDTCHHAFDDVASRP